MNITITLTGDGPILMHNERLANPFDELVREMKALTSKRKKTDDDLNEIMRIEHAGGLYHDPSVGPYLPTWNIKKCFIEGGRISKLGKHIERAFTPLASRAPLAYAGPRTIEGLWADPRFRDVRSVKIGQSKTPRCRPVFNEWTAQFDGYLETTVMNLDEFAASAARAGLMVGLGDFRQRYGRFTVDIAASAE